MYTGQFKEGKKQGYGKLKTTTGCFEGNFKKGYLNNIGVFTWDD